MTGRPVLAYEEIVRLMSEGMSQRAIADRFGVTRAAISHRLRRKASRRNKPRQTHACPCGCGAVTWRKYASQECYFRTVCARDYVPWRQGQRIARSVVSQHFQLRQEHIVHHVDGDNRNNRLDNLWVFASHSDHMSHHRGGLRLPIWRGDQAQ